jgi:prepilin-type N-terminal cleavage/methylation domain-containing protein/prepilin-type processing-associated H-X9-DG protein
MQKNKGFTLIELLVVVAIIAVLISILLPALGKARAMGRASASLSNVRQWGMGTMMFTQQENDRLPWEGDKTKMDVNFADPKWWANAVPPMLGQRTYAQISDEATALGKQVPLPPEQNIFIDPAAKVPTNAPYWSRGKQFFFCYVPNSELNNDPSLSSNAQDAYRTSLSRIEDPSATILMLELRTAREELPDNDPYYSEDLARHRSDWQRFAARHNNGGHMLFADGHGKWISNKIATTSSLGNRLPNKTEDWNKPGLIWNPLSPSIMN